MFCNSLSVDTATGLQGRYILARFRILKLLSGSLSTPLVSGLQRPVHGLLARLLAATSVLASIQSLILENLTTLKDLI